MSSLGTGKEPCEEICVCGQCEFRHGCAGCIDCDPDRTEPDDEYGYGPTKECMHGDKRKVRKCCGTCKWYEHEDITDGFVCVNGESDYVADFTDKKFCCDDYEERFRG